MSEITKRKPKEHQWRRCLEFETENHDFNFKIPHEDVEDEQLGRGGNGSPMIHAVSVFTFQFSPNSTHAFSVFDY